MRSDVAFPMGNSERHATRARRALAACAAACALAAAWPGAAMADLFSYDGQFGSEEAANGRFANPQGLTSDAAGRVYVADAGRGVVEVYDNAEAGNKYLLSIGVGRLLKPIGVWVDNRQRVYVVDAGRDSVDIYDNFNDNFEFRRSFGGSGTERGKMGNPRYVVTDRASRIYVSERDTARVQFWKAKGGDSVSFGAFGTAGLLEGFQEPEGIVRENDDRFYLTDDSAAGGQIQAFDTRGSPIRQVAGPGVEFGQVSAPRGIVRDPAGRLLVVDSGNERVQLFGLFPAGNPFLGAFGSEGGGPGQFRDPTGITIAPGALAYVADAGNGRVVRLHYDDADDDGVLDARDNCVGLANPDQRNTDKNGGGDACDADDDDDGIGDDADKCPRTLRGADSNKDGCADPRSRVTVPGSGKRYKRTPTRFAGTASGDELGVTGVQIAVAKKRGGKCAWFTGKGFGAQAACNAPQFLAASGTARWEARVRFGGRGAFRVVSRATQGGGVVENVLDQSNVHDFRVG